MPRVTTVQPNGKAIRALRKQRGLTLPQLGKMIGRHPQSVRKLEVASPPASDVFLYQIANALQVDVAEITLGEVDDPEDAAEAA